MTNTTIQRTGIAAVAAAAIAQYFANIYGNSAGENGGMAFFLVGVAVCTLLAVWLFRSIVPRSIAAGTQPGARRALTLAVLGVLFALPAFWSGIAYVLGSAGAVLGAAERERGAGNVATAAVALGVLALLANTTIIVLDELG